MLPVWKALWKVEADLPQTVLIMLKLITLFELDAFHILTSKHSEIIRFSSLWRVFRSGTKLYQVVNTTVFLHVTVKCGIHFLWMLYLFVVLFLSPELLLGDRNHIVSIFIPSWAECSLVHSRWPINSGWQVFSLRIKSSLEAQDATCNNEQSIYPKTRDLILLGF